MTSKDYEPLREKLLEQREQAMQLIRAAARTAEAKPGAIQNNLQAVLQNADHALCEMDAGTYGCCDRCGELIPLERLEARPQVTVCDKCMHKPERRDQAASLARSVGSKLGT